MRGRLCTDSLFWDISLHCISFGWAMFGKNREYFFTFISLGWGIDSLKRDLPRGRTTVASQINRDKGERVEAEKVTGQQVQNKIKQNKNKSGARVSVTKAGASVSTL